MSSSSDSVADFVAGSVAGVAVVLVGQPLDTVKTKLQTFRDLYAAGATHCLAHTYRTCGVRGLYAGTWPAVLAGVGENSVLFACYGLCQRTVAAVTGAQDPKRMGALSNAAAGCAASFFSSVVLCPAELIKIKLQAGHELAESRGQHFRGSVYRVAKVGTRGGLLPPPPPYFKITVRWSRFFLVFCKRDGGVPTTSCVHLETVHDRCDPTNPYDSFKCDHA